MKNIKINWRKAIGWTLLIHFFPIICLVFNSYTKEKMSIHPILIGYIVDLIMMAIFGFFLLAAILINDD